MLRIKRIYDPAGPEDGKRYLVDGMWPRGVSKAKAGLDGWLKELAPSAGLRSWFHHEPARWDEFRSRYREELGAAGLKDRLATLRREGREGPVTLLFAARDETRNNAVVLKDVLDAG